MSCETCQFDVEFFQLKLLIVEQEKLIFHHCYIHCDVEFNLSTKKKNILFVNEIEIKENKYLEICQLSTNAVGQCKK